MGLWLYCKAATEHAHSGGATPPHPDFLEGAALPYSIPAAFRLPRFGIVALTVASIDTVETLFLSFAFAFVAQNVGWRVHFRRFYCPCARSGAWLSGAPVVAGGHR